MNIRKWTGIVLAVMLLSTAFTAGAATFTPGDYEASAQGFGGTVSVKLTVDEEAITAIGNPGAGRRGHRADERGVCGTGRRRGRGRHDRCDHHQRRRQGRCKQCPCSGQG